VVCDEVSDLLVVKPFDAGLVFMSLDGLIIAPVAKDGLET
jgi:hypothetical protein